MCVLGVGLSAFCTSLVSFAICFGVIFGLGAGLSYTTPLIVCWGHYPTNRGRITGLLMAVFGYSTSIFNLVTTYVVNPENAQATITEKVGLTTSRYFSEEIARKTPSMLLWLAGVFSLLAVFGVLLISEKEGKAGQAVPVQDTAIAREVVSPCFLTLFIAAFLSIALSTYISSAYKVYGNERFQDDKYLAVVGSVSAVVNGTSRFVWAELFVRVGFKPVYMLVLIVQIVVSATMDAVATTEGLYLIYIVLISMNQGCHFVLLSKIYGRTKGALLYSILYSGFGLSGLAGFLIQKYAIHAIGYQTMYWILTAAAMVSLGLMIPFEEKEEGEKSVTEKLLPVETSQGS